MSWDVPISGQKENNLSNELENMRDCLVLFRTKRKLSKRNILIISSNGVKIESIAAKMLTELQT